MDLWVIVNLVAPVAIPVVGAIIVMLFIYKAGSKSRKGHFIGAFKDGQLCWVALGMCLNALYELFNPAAGKVISKEYSGYMAAALIGALIISTGVAVMGSAIPVPWPKATAPAASWLRRAGRLLIAYAVLVLSVVLTLAVIFVARDIHLTTQV